MVGYSEAAVSADYMVFLTIIILRNAGLFAPFIARTLTGRQKICWFFRTGGIKKGHWGKKTINHDHGYRTGFSVLPDQVCMAQPEFTVSCGYMLGLFVRSFDSDH